MLQMSKLINSRDEWKNKAVQRADEIREHRKADKRNQTKIAELKQQIEGLKRAVEEVKKTLTTTRHKSFP